MEFDTQDDLFDKEKLERVFAFVGCRKSDLLARQILKTIGQETVTSEAILAAVPSHFSTEQNAYLQETLPLVFAIIHRKCNFVVLIGGASGSGKSTLAALLARRLGIRTVSTDDIRERLRDESNANDSPLLFASSYSAGTSLLQQYSKEGPKVPMTFSMELSALRVLSSTDLLLEGFRRHSLLFLPEVLTLLRTVNAVGESIIIEGVHVTTQWVHALRGITRCLIPIGVGVGAVSHWERLNQRSVGSYLSHWEDIRTLENYFENSFQAEGIPLISDSDFTVSVHRIHSLVLHQLKSFTQTHATPGEGVPTVPGDTCHSFPEPLDSLEPEDFQLIRLEREKKDKRKRNKH